MRLNMLGSLLALGLILTGMPALAHHSFDAEYDATKIANFTGVVTQVDWQNPHAFIFMNCQRRKWRHQESSI